MWRSTHDRLVAIGHRRAMVTEDSEAQRHRLARAAEKDVFVRTLLATPRYRDRRHLAHFGYAVQSQADEDGIIAEIFARIGPGARRFVEFGVSTGIECNTMWLLVNGWRGTWIEQDEAACARIRRTHARWLADGTLALAEARITAETIDATIAAASPEGLLDLLSIDIDGNDIWVWNAIEQVRPRVVAIEYNAAWRPPASIAQPYDADFRWQRDNQFGASLAALATIGQRKGYSLVGCTLSGVNAFFVRRDLCGDSFAALDDVAALYEPPRYFLCGIPSGHPRGVGPVVAV